MSHLLIERRTLVMIKTLIALLFFAVMAVQAQAYSVTTTCLYSEHEGKVSCSDDLEGNRVTSTDNKCYNEAVDIVNKMRSTPTGYSFIERNFNLIVIKCLQMAGYTTKEQWVGDKLPSYLQDAGCSLQAKPYTLCTSKKCSKTHIVCASPGTGLCWE